MSQFSAGQGELVTLQDAQTVGNGNTVSPAASIKLHSFYIKGNGAIGAGAIQIETASDPDYSGTWAAIGSPITVVASSEVIVTLEGSYQALRARISTTITTTTGTVKYRGN